MIAFFNVAPVELFILLILSCVVLLVVGMVVTVVIFFAMKKPPIGANLVPCPDCRQSVSRAAKSCPHCGKPFKPEAIP